MFSVAEISEVYGNQSYFIKINIKTVLRHASTTLPVDISEDKKKPSYLKTCVADHFECY